MSTLKFPIRSSPKSLPKLYTLKRVDTSKGVRQLTAIEPKLMFEGNSRVFRAIIECEGFTETADSVCKVVSGEENIERLRKEAGFYSNQLRKLQGVVVPRFIGLFEGLLGDEPVACLVTTYCGERLPLPVFGMTWEFKESLLKAIDMIHCAGVQHNDLFERNLLIDSKNRPFIVDFDHAEPHECLLDMPICFHDEEPEPDEFGCDELHLICKRAGVWMPRFIRFMLCYMPACLAETPQLLASNAPEYISPEDALGFAYKAIKEYEAYNERRLACDWNAYY